MLKRGAELGLMGTLCAACTMVCGWMWGCSAEVMTPLAVTACMIVVWTLPVGKVEE
jgi:hypothetical protein